MGQGAARNDINILYCMSYSRHMMQETVSLMCIFYFLFILQKILKKRLERVLKFKMSSRFGPQGIINQEMTSGISALLQFGPMLQDLHLSRFIILILFSILQYFKDTFWTTADQPGNPLYKNKTEIHPELESAMATLSTGIVGISDKSNFEINLH